MSSRRLRRKRPRSPQSRAVAASLDRNAFRRPPRTSVLITGVSGPACEDDARPAGELFDTTGLGAAHVRCGAGPFHLGRHSAGAGGAENPTVRRPDDSANCSRLGLAHPSRSVRVAPQDPPPKPTHPVEECHPKVTVCSGTGTSTAFGVSKTAFGSARLGARSSAVCSLPHQSDTSLSGRRAASGAELALVEAPGTRSITPTDQSVIRDRAEGLRP